MQPNPLTRFLVLFGLIFIGGVAVNYTHKMLMASPAPAMADLKQDDPPSDWKLSVQLNGPDGTEYDTLVLMDRDNPGHPRLWKSLFDCEKYQETAEFKDTLPKLKEFLERAFPPDTKPKFICTPVPRGRAA